jgi:hypothetical protein
VLQSEENSKSMAIMIKEKDLCHRQNFKLLQMLDIKEKVIQRVIEGIKTKSIS